MEDPDLGNGTENKQEKMQMIAQIIYFSSGPLIAKTGK
jgi:hypothetical protein